MQNSMKSLLVLTLWFNALAAEKNIIIHALTAASNNNLRSPRDVSGPSIPVTPKPPCPSYITCPYPPYPRPTTNSPSTEKDISVPSTTITTYPEKEIEDRFGPEKTTTTENSQTLSELIYMPDNPISENRPGNAQGPSISATSKPPCPSYINCPYPPYPRPTTKPPQPESVTTPSSVTTPLEDRFGQDKPSTTENSEPVSELSSVPDNPISENRPGNAQGPSISATSKPPCPSYINCPYPPYPRPTTKPPQPESVTPPSSVTTPLEDRFGQDKPSTTENSEPVGELSSVPDNPISENRPGNAQGPSISATSKPPCPSYINCPYPSYPRPTTKPPQPESVTTSSPISTPDKLLEDRFGPEKDNPPSVSEDNFNPDEPVKVNKPAPNYYPRPSVSATQKPPCPSYITCPYPSYPRPTTRRPFLDEKASAQALISDEKIVQYFGVDSSTLPDELQSVSESSSPPTNTQDTDAAAIPLENTDNAIAPVKTYDDEGANKNPNSSDSESTISNKNSELQSNKQESVTSNESSEVKGPEGWYFPGLSNGDVPIDSRSPDKPTYQADSAHISRGPSISATQKPRCSSYAPCPYIYPKPTTSSPIVHNRISYVSTPNEGDILTSNNNPVLHTNSPNVDPYLGSSVIPQQHPSPQDPLVLGNQGVFLPIYSYIYGIDNYNQNPYYLNRRPVLLTQRPFWPSYLKNPWIYPRPFGSDYLYDQEFSATSNEESDDISSDEKERDISSDIENKSD